MKKGCFVGLLTWAICGGAYWYFLHQRFGAPLDKIVPIAAGFLMAVVVGNLRIGLASAFSAIEVSQQSTAVIGERPPDGKLLTVSGPIRATGPALTTPFSGRPAVLYTYDVSHLSQGSRDVHFVKDYSGFAMAPSAIDTRFGAIRIMGFPQLQGFGSQLPDSAMNNVKEYIANTTFTEMSGFDVIAMYNEVKSRLTDDAGQMRHDLRLTSDEIPPDATLVEEVVTPGEQVTAIGRYSAEKGGLIPDINTPLQIVRGDAVASSAALWRKARGTVVAALFFAAVINAGLFGVLHFAGNRKIAIPKSSEEVRQSVDGLHNAARNGDLPAIQRYVAAGMSVDSRDDEGKTPLMRAADAKIAGWLVSNGADVNAMDHNGDTALMEQARAGNTDVVKVLVKSGSNLDRKSTTYKSTALEQALDAEKLDVAQVLRDAGAQDDTVTEKNGHALKERDEPVTVPKSWLAAIHREDLQAMRAVTTYPIKEADFKTWKDVFPPDARMVSGFGNDKAATVVLRGKRLDGSYATFTFQLVHTAYGWEIGNERWETRLDSKEK
jgi:ankyrin repeat protein